MSEKLVKKEAKKDPLINEDWVGINEIVNEISLKYLTPQKTIRSLIYVFIETIQNFVSEGRKIKIPGLFSCRPYLVELDPEKAKRGFVPRPTKYYSLTIKAAPKLREVAKLSEIQKTIVMENRKKSEKKRYAELQAKIKTHIKEFEEEWKNADLEKEKYDELQEQIQELKNKCNQAELHKDGIYE